MTKLEKKERKENKRKEKDKIQTFWDYMFPYVPYYVHRDVARHADVRTLYGSTL